ncbi:MAG: hypothetical protein JW940_25785 [Polyangiaceae bacterium]|nr:hypothetical protein [Polyangiaceae bacterium]
MANPYRIELSHPLRYTTVWTTGSPLPGYSVLGGGAVNARTGEFQVELGLPSREVSQRLAPTNDLYLYTQAADIRSYEVVDAYRPRVVLYEDVNDNEQLDLPRATSAAPDRVLAIDDDYYTMGAVLDVEALLREAAPALVDLYYEATGGRFTAFIPTRGTGDYVYVGEASFTYTFLLDDSGIAFASLECLRNVSTRSTALPPNVVLDDALDTALCGLDYGACRSDELDRLPAPAVSMVSSSGYQRQAVCRRREDLEALAVNERRLGCERCECVSESTLDVFVAAREELPPWWPCGDQVVYCESESSLTGYPSECLGLAGLAGGTQSEG